MSVEKLLDELWVGAKDQSNSVIAGSLRNIFRYSLVFYPVGVEHWFAEGPYRDTNASQTPNTIGRITGVRRRGISFVVKRETAQTVG